MHLDCSSDEDGLTAEVLIVIVGARGRRGRCGDGEVRPFPPTSVMVRSATWRQECMLKSACFVHKYADNILWVAQDNASKVKVQQVC